MSYPFKEYVVFDLTPHEVDAVTFGQEFPAPTCITLRCDVTDKILYPSFSQLRYMGLLIRSFYDGVIYFFKGSDTLIYFDLDDKKLYIEIHDF